MESNNHNTKSSPASSDSHIPEAAPRLSRESQSRFVEHIDWKPSGEDLPPPRTSDDGFEQVDLHSTDSASPTRVAKVKAKMMKIIRAPKKVTDRIRSASGTQAEGATDPEAQVRERRPRASAQQIFKVVQIAQVLVIFLIFILAIAILAKQDSQPNESSPTETEVPHTTAPAVPDVPPTQGPSPNDPVVTDPQTNPIFGGTDPEDIANPAIPPTNDVPDPMDPTNPNPSLPPVRRSVTRDAFYPDIANHEVNIPSAASQSKPKIPVFVDVGDLELPVP